MQELRADKDYLTKHNAGDGPNGTSNPLSTGVLGTQDGSGGAGAATLKHVYLDAAFPVTPVAGLHVVRIKSGERVLGFQGFRV